MRNIFNDQNDDDLTDLDTLESPFLGLRTIQQNARQRDQDDDDIQDGNDTTETQGNRFENQIDGDGDRRGNGRDGGQDDGNDRADRGRDNDGPGNGDDDTTIVTRSIDGSGTNTENVEWGATHQELLRIAPNSYVDGIGEVDTTLPNAREISNALAQTTEETENSFGASNLLWAWGQFLDHDLSLTEAGETQPSPIFVPDGDPVFADGAIIPFNRVEQVEGTGVDSERVYENEITSYIDASMVYGSDAETAASLRDGAYMILDENGLLLQTETGVLAGDVRAAENIALTSLHTLFAREHNRWVDELSESDPSLTEDELFDAARMRVEAEIQAITYNEFHAMLLGDEALTAYEGYDATVNPGISVEFSTAAYRFGHSLLSSEIERLNEDGTSIDAGSISLQEAFFNPDAITESGGIESILRGLASSSAQELDTMIVEDVRSFLFAPTGEAGLDLAALNIERGRDLGVASYNDMREAFGLERAETFADITSDAEIAATLDELYGSVDNVDAWVGGLAEDPLEGGMLGETFSVVIIDQFTRLRDGDALWSEAGQFSDDDLDALWSTTLADVIEMNTDIDSLQDSAFLSYERNGGTEGDDVLVGTDASDLLLGNEGNDTLEGGAGDDQLEGGDGDDFLVGGAGDDLLYGNDGADIFFFALSDGHDVIADFGGSDLIQFDDVVAPSLDDLSQVGNDTVLTLDAETSVTLLGVDVDQVADQFMFA